MPVDMKSIAVAGAALNQTPLDWAGNRAHILEAIAQARNQRAALLCLPELAISGYGCEDAFFSDYVVENSLAVLKDVVAASEGLVVSVGLPLVYENCVYNVCALIQNKQLLGFVAKQELAGDGVHYEPRWFKRWPEGLVAQYRWEGKQYPLGDVIFEIDGVRLGFEICEDAWNGVRPAQDFYLNNVDIILNPSASHFAFGKTHTRHSLVVEASRSYQCAYVYSNLLGNEAGRIVYDGEIIIAQQGELLARNRRFSYQSVQVLCAAIDPAPPRRAKKKSFNFEPERSLTVVYGNAPLPDADAVFNGKAQSAGSTRIAPFESKEEEFYRAVTLGLWDYMRKSRSRGFVLSLSGGADSSACAVLAVHAVQNALAELGAEAFAKHVAYFKIDASKPLAAQILTTAYQSTANSGPATLNSARELAKALGAQFILWDIEPQLQGYHALAEQALGRKLSWDADDIVLQNIQARVRAPGIWMLANLGGGLLLTTSNRSEAAVGYATMDGDTAGGLAPLGGIDKAFLLHWLRWAETALNLPALKHVNSLQPTAELRPADRHQTDEKDLMPYPVLDAIERCAIHEYKSPVETFRALRGTATDADLLLYVKRFYTLWARNQWKRERYAPCFHLDDANLDPRTWCRFPILSGGYAQELQALEAYVAQLQTVGVKN
jgi:NAD+ synthase (glutamine-hydrolysing)